MERKIGETFEYEGKVFKVKEAEENNCNSCFFNAKYTTKTMKLSGECDGDFREDEKKVIFVEVQGQPQEEREVVKERQIGEVFEYEGKKLKVVETANNLCFDCYFFDGVLCQKTGRECGHCQLGNRSDYKSVIFVEVKDEQPHEQDEQPQKLNLCEVLKYCPQGETFWSPMLGDVKFYGIDQMVKRVCVTATSNINRNINADGTATIDGVTSPEVMLYPSREQRDWTKVKYEPKKEKFDPKTFKAFDKVLCRARQIDTIWHCDFFSHLRDRIHVCSGLVADYVVPYNDDTKYLVGTTDEAPDFYKYWED